MVPNSYTKYWHTMFCLQLMNNKSELYRWFHTTITEPEMNKRFPMATAWSWIHLGLREDMLEAIMMLRLTEVNRRISDLTLIIACKKTDMDRKKLFNVTGWEMTCKSSFSGHIARAAGKSRTPMKGWVFLTWRFEERK